MINSGYLCSMKRLIYLFVICASLVFVGCGNKQNGAEYNRNKKELMRIRTKYMGYYSLADEAGIDSLVQYFMVNGTEDDRFLANLYRGYYFFDNHEWAHAYETFKQTYGLRPENVTEHSDEVLEGLFSACVWLCIKDRDIPKAKEWLELTEQSGVFSKENYCFDYLEGYLALNDQQEDSCINCLNRSFEDVKSRKVWTKRMSWCLHEQAKLLALMGRTVDFKKRFNLLKDHPFNVEDATTELSMGLFYAQNGMRDSALFFYRNAMQSEMTDVALEASLQLAIDARNHGENDSVFKYFQNCVTLYDKLIDERQNSYSRRIETMYRTQELKEEVAEQKLQLMTLLFCMTLVLLLALGGWMMTIALKNRLKVTAQRVENIKKEREVLATELQRTLQEIERLEQLQAASEHTEVQAQFESLCFKLKQCAANKQAAPHHLCDELVRTFAATHRGIIPSLQQAYADIKPHDVLVCILAKCGFGLTEIACITNYERQEIRQFILRISKGLTGHSVGRITEFRDAVDGFVEEHEKTHS